MKQSNIMKSIKIIYGIAPVLAIMIAILTIFSLVCSPLFSIIDKYLFDTLQSSIKSGLDLHTILGIVMLYFGYYFLLFVLYKAIDIVNSFLRVKVSATLQKRVIKKLKDVPYDNFENNEFYNYLTTIQSEVEGGNFLAIYANLISVIGICLTLIYLSGILMGFSIMAVIISIACCIPGFVHQARFGKKNWDFNTSQIPLQRKTNYVFSLLSSLNAYKENKIFNTTEFYKNRYNGLFSDYYKDLKKFNSSNCWKGIVMASIHALGTVGVIAYAYISAARGNISLGDAVMYVGISQSIYNNVQNFVYYFGSLCENRYRVNNIIEFLGNTGRLHEGMAGEKNKEKCRAVGIELENVGYKYPNTEKWVLDGFSVTIKPNQKVAIVGENGSGKSTLAKVVLGLYKPQYGTVNINGVNVADIGSPSAFSTICFQDYFTYSFTVRENIAFGNIGELGNDARIKDAANKSGFSAEIYDDNLDTYINKDFDSSGRVLSGGQAQKMSLARAFVNDVGLLILDEPSASLDIITENEIFESTLALIKNKTTIIITHRLANVINSDMIVYIENGRVCEQGSHAELMEAKGRYFELFNIQAQKYRAAYEQ